MRLLERIYRSALGRPMSAMARMMFWFQKPQMLYGYVDPQSRNFRKFVRISSSTSIIDPEKFVIGDYVWVWHNTILDASGGLEIGEGCQIGAWVGVFTHGSQNAIRMLGKRFVDIPNAERQYYTRAPIRIGRYTFISSGSVILPGVTIGEGCIIGPNSLIMKDVPDHAVVITTPARQVSDTLQIDIKMLGTQDAPETYYDRKLFNQTKGTI